MDHSAGDIHGVLNDIWFQAKYPDAFFEQIVADIQTIFGFLKSSTSHAPSATKYHNKHQSTQDGLHMWTDMMDDHDSTDATL
jgi:hypothetical protein